MSNKGSAGTGSTNGAVPMSIRGRIALAPQVAREVLAIPEWDVTLEVRGIMLGDRSDMMRDGYTQDERPRPIYHVFYPLLLTASCFDPTDGKPVFSSTDAEFINQLNPGVVDRVARVAMRLSGMSGEGTEKNVGGESLSDITASSSLSS